MPETQVLSNEVVSTNGKILPSNFDKLSEKKQRNIILAEIAELNNDISSIDDFEDDAKHEIKKIKMILESSKEFKKQLELKNKTKSGKMLRSQLISERKGMMKLAVKLGMDVKEEIKKIKAIEQ